MSNNTIGICVVGTNWGVEHCHWIRQVAPATRLFLCGRDATRTAEVAKRFQAEGHFLDVADAASDDRVTAMTIAVPHDVHREVAEAGLQGGKDVMVEKPIAGSLADAEAMIAAAEKAGRILMVAENMHFRPALREAREQILSGRIGKPLYMHASAGGPGGYRGWRQDQLRMGGGVMIDKGVHYVRAMRRLMGEPEEVFARRVKQVDTRMEGEDSAQASFFNRSDGWQATLMVSCATHRIPGPAISVIGDEGTLSIWTHRHSIDFFSHEPSWADRLIEKVKPYRLQKLLRRPGMRPIRLRCRFEPKSAYLVQIEAFLRCLADRTEPESTPQDARRDLHLALEAERAMDSSAPIDVTL